MPLTNIARTHLFYQSIILIIIFLSLSYNAILPESKTTFLIFVPTFVYQLFILLCWTEVFPVPDWMNSNDQEKKGETISNQQKGKTTRSKPDVEIENNKTQSVARSRSFGSRTYKFRNWKSNWQEDNLTSVGTRDNTTSQKLNKWSYGNSITVPRNSNSVTKQQNSWTYPNNRDESQESIKRYFFPYRQKRCGQWIDDEVSERPYKVRNWESEIEKSDIGYQANLDKVVVTNKTDFTDDTDSNDEAGLNKSYSFPFRHRKMEEMFDKNEHAPNFSNKFTPMPYWKSVSYDVAKKGTQNSLQSTPVVHLTDEDAVDGETEDNDRDFSRSVEVTCSLNKDLYRKNIGSMSSSSLRPKKYLSQSSSNSFQKITRGVSKYFAKNKESVKDIEKPTRKISFKGIFRNSKRSSVHSTDNSAKFDNKVENGLFSYVSYDKEHFEFDTHKKMVEEKKI